MHCKSNLKKKLFAHCKPNFPKKNHTGSVRKAQFGHSDRSNVKTKTGICLLDTLRKNKVSPHS